MSVIFFSGYGLRVLDILKPITALGVLVRYQFNDRVIGIVRRHIQRYWLSRRKRQRLFAAIGNQQKWLSRAGNLARHGRQPNVSQLVAATERHAFNGSQANVKLGIGAG
jgi:hypothetical protein